MEYARICCFGERKRNTEEALHVSCYHIIWGCQYHMGTAGYRGDTGELLRGRIPTRGVSLDGRPRLMTLWP